MTPTSPLRESRTALLVALSATAACSGLDASLTVNPSCPCYDTSYLDDLFVNDETYALTWDDRWRDGLSEVLSLRGYSWYYNIVDGVWESPTVGADAYRDPEDGNQAYCEVWSGTWIAAPVHDWADDIRSAQVRVSDVNFAACDQHLRTWIASEEVLIYTW